MEARENFHHENTHKGGALKLKLVLVQTKTLNMKG